MSKINSDILHIPDSFFPGYEIRQQHSLLSILNIAPD